MKKSVYVLLMTIFVCSISPSVFAQECDRVTSLCEAEKLTPPDQIPEINDYGLVLYETPGVGIVPYANYSDDSQQLQDKEGTATTEEFNKEGGLASPYMMRNGSVSSLEADPELAMPYLLEAPSVTEASTAAPALTPSPEPTQLPQTTETPAVSETPTSTEIPIATETPLVSDTPMASETPLPTETPMASETPAISQEPVATMTPMASPTPLPTESPEPPLYVDMNLHWAEYAAGKLYKYNIWIGEKIGQYYYFRPEQTISRIEFTNLILSVLGENVGDGIGSEVVFDDEATMPKYVKDPAKKAHSLGIIKGVPTGGKLYFQPYATLNRVQAAQIINNALGVGEATNQDQLGFTDKNDIPAWAHGAIKNLKDYAIISGYEDNTFRPYEKVTRAHTAIFIWQLKKTMDVNH